MDGDVRIAERFRGRIGHIYPIRRRIGHIYLLKRLSVYYGCKDKVEG
ncbi:MAG: hypothetical protein RMJ00_06880 [Nitrososphaerota archaeon]|nr:hypothetical protein [Candidatus Bathyarchaeota archaeon]MCX8162287.1 hypothetical protein [Candidatus Bathyarchaeota archaeon]MDW8062406.1 hypothetical protein [Nitrososphaerota archaeon]